MRRSNGENTERAGPVRVSKNGNARTLVVPAEIVRAAHVETGDQYMVEVTDGDLVFSPIQPGRERGRFVGEGANRVLEFSRGAGMPAGADPVQPDPIDWDF